MYNELKKFSSPKDEKIRKKLNKRNLELYRQRKKLKMAEKSVENFNCPPSLVGLTGRYIYRNPAINSDKFWQITWDEKREVFVVEWGRNGRAPQGRKIITTGKAALKAIQGKLVKGYMKLGGKEEDTLEDTKEINQWAEVLGYKEKEEKPKPKKLKKKDTWIDELKRI